MPRLAMSEDLRKENEGLRARIVTLHAAILWINVSLDLDTVPCQVVESAHGLTGTRWGSLPRSTRQARRWISCSRASPRRKSRYSSPGPNTCDSSTSYASCRRVVEIGLPAAEVVSPQPEREAGSPFHEWSARHRAVSADIVQELGVRMEIERTDRVVVVETCRYPITP